MFSSPHLALSLDGQRNEIALRNERRRFRREVRWRESTLDSQPLRVSDVLRVLFATACVMNECGGDRGEGGGRGGGIG